MARIRSLVCLTLPFVLFACATNVDRPSVGNGPLTRAESSDYKATSRHDDVLKFIVQLAPLSSDISVQSMGQTAKGKDIPVIVLSRDHAFDPETAHALKKPIVMVVANIHAGEVEGKEAVLMLARDMVLGTLTPWQNDMTLVFVPNFNADGNDLIKPENRKLHLKELWGQLGPEEGVGERQTSEGIDLNRDYLLLRAPESQHLNDLFHAWEPDVYVDCHTTNGSILAYELTFDAPHPIASAAAGPMLFSRDRLLPEISARLEARTGRRTFFYGNFRDNLDPSKGYETYPALPRYGANFRGLCGTIDVLLETYSYCDFKTRCDVNREILRELFDFVKENADDVMSVVADAKAETIERGKVSAPDDWVGISYMKLSRDAKGKIGFEFPVYPLFDTEIASYETAALVAHQAPGKEVTFWPATYYGRYVPTVFVRRPLGYLVPQSETKVIEHLKRHKIVTQTIGEPKTFARGERYFVLAKEETPTSIGGMTRKDAVFFTRAEEQALVASPGDVFVPMDQPIASVAIYLLEPEADDGLARWGFFGDVMPNTYYPIARILPAEGTGGAQ